MDFRRDIKDYYDELIKTMKDLDIEEINTAINVLIDAYRKEKCIYVFGNGGSAATASHIVCDFNKGVSLNLDTKFRFICLNDNIPMLTAISNDISYEEVFRYPLNALVKEGDVVLAISGSGNSTNVINAVECAKKKGAIIIGMTGYEGGKLFALADYHLHAPINNMMKAEDIHMTFDHMIMSILTLFLNKK